MSPPQGKRVAAGTSAAPALSCCQDVPWSAMPPPWLGCTLGVGDEVRVRAEITLGRGVRQVGGVLVGK